MMDDGDLVSRLPRDLVISILSRLTFKEATRTSVLSRRWEKLWTFFNGDLDFIVSHTLRQNGCSNYARLVDKVLNTLQLVEDVRVLDSFTIHFNLCPDNFTTADRWVQFASDKCRAKRLDFDGVLLYLSGCKHYIPTFDFPRQYFHAQQCSSNIRMLTSIRFRLVNLSDEIVGDLLSNCPLLQSLELRNIARTLNHLTVSGETLALRHLTIWDCLHLTTVVICAPNLVSLTYYVELLPRLKNLTYFTRRITNVKFDVQNAPKLAELSMGFLDTPFTALAFRLLTLFSRIQKLELDISSKEPEDSIKLIKLTSLKHLTVKARCWDHMVAWTSPMVKACPVLQKLTLDMHPFRMEPEILGGVMRENDDKFPSKCLKVFELFGFNNSNDDNKLVTYFVERMVRPEKIIVHHIYGERLNKNGLTHPFLLVTSKIRSTMKLRQTIREEIILLVD